METYSSALYGNYRSATHIKTLLFMKITFYIFLNAMTHPSIFF